MRERKRIEKMLDQLVRALGGEYHAFLTEDHGRVEAIKRASPAEELRARLLQELGQNPSPADRYKVEYRNGLYQSYKSGIDDVELNRVVGMAIEDVAIIEIGGGPAYLAERGRVRICCDLAEHPRFREKGIEPIIGDFCEEATLSQCLDRVSNEPSLLVALSYCLDRMADQRKALRHFARMVKETRGIGLITVCLPALPKSSGIETVSYAGGEWITEGRDALTDYRLIVNACQKEGLTFRTGGLTTHYNVCLDGYETLPCYVMVFGSS